MTVLKISRTIAVYSMVEIFSRGAFSFATENEFRSKNMLMATGKLRSLVGVNFQFIPIRENQLPFSREQFAILGVLECYVYAFPKGLIWLKTSVKVLHMVLHMSRRINITYAIDVDG